MSFGQFQLFANDGCALLGRVAAFYSLIVLARNDYFEKGRFRKKDKEVQKTRGKIKKYLGPESNRHGVAPEGV